MSKFTDSGFGPDNLSYEEALAQAWASSPKLPDNGSVNPGSRAGNSRRSVARRSSKGYAGSLQHQRAYDGPLTRLPSPTKEGIRIMARARAAAAVAEPEETESSAAEPAEYATKNITPAAQAFAEWISEQTGHGGELGSDEHGDHTRSVYLAMALRRKFQADPATRDRIDEIREERAEAAKAEKASRAPTAEEGAEEEPKPKPRGRAKASTVTSTSSVSKPAAAAKGGTTGRRGAAPATPRTRRGAAAKPAPGEAPF